MSGVLKQMCCRHKNGILKRKAQNLEIILKFASGKEKFPFIKGNYNSLDKGNTCGNKLFAIHKFLQNFTPNFTMSFD